MACRRIPHPTSVPSRMSSWPVLAVRRRSPERRRSGISKVVAESGPSEECGVQARYPIPRRRVGVLHIGCRAYPCCSWQLMVRSANHRSWIRRDTFAG